MTTKTLDLIWLLGFLSFNILSIAVVGSCIVLWVGTFCYPATVGLFLFLPYYTSIFLFGRPELKDGARWVAFSKHFPLFPPARKYLSVQLHVSQELADADKHERSRFVFAVFPHGANADFRLMMDGMLPAVLPNLSNRMRVLTASVLFYIPLAREIALWTGCVDARRQVAEKLLRTGRSILVLPGGQSEQIRTVNGKERIYLRNRKGFIKLALQQGVAVVPVYCFGASDYYLTSPVLFYWRLWLLKSTGIAIPLSFGEWGCLLCPRPIPTTIVFGKPLNWTLASPGSPSDDELNTAHNKFCSELQHLFDEHKTKLGYGDRTLEIS